MEGRMGYWGDKVEMREGGGDQDLSLYLDHRPATTTIQPSAADIRSVRRAAFSPKARGGEGQEEGAAAGRAVGRGHNFWVLPLHKQHSY
jgi:hypothetical protein